jgi:hypothetical protein
MNGVPINQIGGVNLGGAQGGSQQGAAPGAGPSGTNGGVSTLYGRGGAGYNVLSTLTPQQQQLMNQLQTNLKSPNTGINPQQTAQYIQQSVATPLLRQYDQSIMPRINDAYASVGALMGSRRGFASQTALQNLQDNIGEQLGKAQLANQQQNASLGLGYNQLAAQLTNQSQMAIQPFGQNLIASGATPFGGSQLGGSMNFGGFNGGSSGQMSNPFSGFDSSGSASNPYSSVTQFNPSAVDPSTFNTDSVL